MASSRGSEELGLELASMASPRNRGQKDIHEYLNELI